MTASGGLSIAQRGTGSNVRADLTVGPVRPVQIPDGPALEAHNVDAALWRRLWSCEDRMVVEFIGVTVVEAADDGRVTFDRLLAADLEQHLLLDHVLPLVLARRGEVVLHGAVLGLAGRGAVLMGSSGAGKSTLTAYAWQQGWTVGGDDGAVVSAGPPVSADPTYSTIRLTPAAAELLAIVPEPGSAVAGKMRLTGRGVRPFQQAPVSLSVIAVLEPVAAGVEAAFIPMRGVEAHAELFGSTFHVDLTGGPRMRHVVASLASVVEQVTVGRLRVPRGIEGLRAAEILLGTILP